MNGNVKSLKQLLKSADDAQTVELLVNVNAQVIRTDGIEKVKDELVKIFSQEKPRINKNTREAYNTLITNVVASSTRNYQQIGAKARDFKKKNEIALTVTAPLEQKSSLASASL